MTITYIWALQGDGSLECAPSLDGKTNVVKTVHWRLNGSDGVHSGTTYGAQAIPYAQGEDFTPFAELTEEQVLGWVRDAMGKDEVAIKMAAVDDQIAVLATPQTVAPALPWAEPAPDPEP